MEQAGWYDDPDGSGLQRYWDGSTWTTALREPPPPQPRVTPRRSPLVAVVIAVVLMAVVAAVATLTMLWGGGGQNGSDQYERTPILDLLAASELPTQPNELLVFTDLDALVEAGLLAQPEPDGDGWSSAADTLEYLPPGPPYWSFLTLGRVTELDIVVGLAFDEVGGSVSTGLRDDRPARHLPRIDVAELETRLDSSTVWERRDGPEPTFRRTRPWEPADLPNSELEVDSMASRLLEAGPESLSITDGALLIGPDDVDRALGTDAAASRLLDVLADQAPAYGLVSPHFPALARVADGHEPLDPAGLIAIIAHIEDGQIVNRLHLEYASSELAEQNAGTLRANLDVNRWWRGDVETDGSHVTARVELDREASDQPWDPNEEVLLTLRRLGSPGTLFELMATDREAAPTETG